MAQLLVSVRDASEAREAVCGGASLIDVKEPARGSLGAADPAVIAGVVREVGGLAPISVALGEMTELLSTQGHLSFEEVRFAKVGLAGCLDLPDWPTIWGGTLGRLPASTSPVAVIYADWETCRGPHPDDVLCRALPLGCCAVLVDTYHKSSAMLFDHWPEPSLRSFVERIRQAGLLVVLAGSLTRETIPRAVELDPDYIAVRGAACEGGRQGRVRAELVRELAERLGLPNR